MPSIDLWLIILIMIIDMTFTLRLLVPGPVLIVYILLTIPMIIADIYFGPVV